MIKKVTKTVLFRDTYSEYTLLEWDWVGFGGGNFVAKFSKSHVSIWDQGWREILRTPKVNHVKLVELYCAISKERT